MGDYSAICELRGRAASGLGCTAINGSGVKLRYCGLHSGSYTRNCNSSTTDIDSLVDANIPSSGAIGDVLEAEIMGGAGMPAIATTIPGNGKILRIRFKGITSSTVFDLTKAYFTVARPGYSADRVWHPSNVFDMVTINGLYRLAYPNSTVKMVQQVGSDLDTYWAISDHIFAKDTITNLTVQVGFYGACNSNVVPAVLNNSTRPYEMPQVDMVAAAPFPRMSAAGLYMEWAVWHHGARGGRTVAAVDIYVNDTPTAPLTGNVSSVAVNAMTLSTLVAPYPPAVFAATVPITGLTNGDGGASIRVYPWISDNVPWDLASYGAPRIDDTSIPAFWPVCVDSDDSFKYARAYVSHTGATIGAPTLSTAALGAYVPGTTPAFATVAALMAAGKTFNNSGSRTRAHNDVKSIETVIPNGTAIAGFGGDLSDQALYPVGTSYGQLPKITSESGADLTTTGLTFAASATNKRFRHLELNTIGLFPTPGAVTNTLVDGLGAGASTAPPATVSAAVLFRMKGCTGTSTGDGSGNTVVFRGGYKFLVNNTLTGFGNWATSNYLQYQGTVIHGGTYDDSYLAVPAALSAVTRACGAHFYQQCFVPEEAARAMQFQVGQMYYNFRLDTKNTGGGVNTNLGTLRTAGIGDRGMAVFNVLIDHRATAGARAALQIHADFQAGPVDTPPCRNISVFNVTVQGQRYNRGYIEVGSNSAIKEFYESYLALSQMNNKGDTSTVAAPADGARIGALAFRFSTGCHGRRLVANSSGTGSVYSDTGWLGEVPSSTDAINLTSAAMYVSDTSADGTNDYASAGDPHPLAALKNIVPAGKAPLPFDLLGTVVPNDGSGAAGAIQ